jgi:4-amino-4-deoxy-L-arabinose transferase-like glycosyltransferase
VERRTERTVLALILVLFAVLGVTYSVVVPPFEASDELWHYPMVKYIADHWALSVQTPGVETSWRQEGSQPPLYYFLGALATCWIDTSDMEEVRHLNHHVDNGVATPDGNINLVVHQPAREAFPWHGTVLAVHLVRLLSVLMGVAAVYLTYLIVRQVLPDDPALALGAAAIHAFTPMYVFISGSVNNDNLVLPLSNLALLMLLRLIQQRAWTTRQALMCYLALGVALGLAFLTKTSAVLLTVLTALVVTARAVRRRSWIEFLVGGSATLTPFLALVGWWLLRNLRLYGDLTGFNMFLVILGTRDVPADLAQLWRERYSFAAGYWGNFGGLNVPMPAWTYSVLNALVVVAALGLIVLWLRKVRGIDKPLTIECWPMVICVLWGLCVFLAWGLWWARITWSSQGRLVFTSMLTWAFLLALGIAGWFPRRWGRWAAAAVALFLLCLTVIAPFAWIKPAYALPEPLADAQAAAISSRLDVSFGAADSPGAMRLLGYDLEAETVEAGGQVGVTLYWGTLSPTDRDYTTFVHLVNERDLIVAQRDTYPGLGLLSTTWLEPGFRWADRYVIQLPDTAYAPDVAQIEVGLYDRVSGMRLSAMGLGGELLGDHVRFGQVRVRARPGDYPNPVSVNFGGWMELIGYDLDQRAAQPGEMVTLTLHWRCLRWMNADYTVSAQLVDSVQRKAAQRDGWPVDGTALTTAWKPGQELTDVYPLEIYPDAALGVYNVRLAVYLYEDGNIQHLPITPKGGRMQAYHIVLTTVRVEP